MQVINVNLSKIPKELIFKSEKTGESFITLVVDSRKEADQYGNDLSVSISQSKEQREQKQQKIYCGSGKTYTFAKAEPTPQTYATATANTADTDDLPF